MDKYFRSSFMIRSLEKGQKPERPQQPNRYLFEQQLNYFIREIDKKTKKVSQLKNNLKAQKSASTDQQQETLNEKLSQVKEEQKAIKFQKQQTQDEIKEINKNQLIMESRKDYNSQQTEDQEKTSQQIGSLDSKIQEIQDKIKQSHISTSDRISLKQEIDDFKTKKQNLLKTTVLSTQGNNNFSSKERLQDKLKVLENKIQELQRKEKNLMDQINAFKSKSDLQVQGYKVLTDQIDEANSQISELEKQKEELQKEFVNKYQKWELDYEKWKSNRSIGQIDTRKVTQGSSSDMQSLNTLNMDALKSANNQIEVDIEDGALLTQPTTQPSTQINLNQQTPQTQVTPNDNKGKPNYSQVRSSGYGQLNKQYSSRKSVSKDRQMDTEGSKQLENSSLKPQKLQESFSQQSSKQKVPKLVTTPKEQSKQSILQSYEEKLILCDNLLHQLGLNRPATGKLAPTKSIRSLKEGGTPTSMSQTFQKSRTDMRGSQAFSHRPGGSRRSSEDQGESQSNQPLSLRRTLSKSQRDGDINHEPVYTPEQVDAIEFLGLRVPLNQVEARDIGKKIENKKEQLEALVARQIKKDNEASNSKSTLDRLSSTGKVRESSFRSNEKPVTKTKGRASMSNSKENSQTLPTNKETPTKNESLVQRNLSIELDHETKPPIYSPSKNLSGKPKYNQDIQTNDSQFKDQQIKDKQVNDASIKNQSVMDNSTQDQSIKDQVLTEQSFEDKSMKDQLSKDSSSKEQSPISKDGFKQGNIDQKASNGYSKSNILSAPNSSDAKNPRASFNGKKESNPGIEPNSSAAKNLRDPFTRKSESSSPRPTPNDRTQKGNQEDKKQASSSSRGSLGQKQNKDGSMGSFGEGTSSYENLDKNILNQTQQNPSKPGRSSLLGGLRKSTSLTPQNSRGSKKSGDTKTNQEGGLKKQGSFNFLRKTSSKGQKQQGGTGNQEKEQESQLNQLLDQNGTQEAMGQQAQVEQDQAKKGRISNGKKSGKGFMSYSSTKK